MAEIPSSTSSAPSRLLGAAAELIVEVGWGQVSTRRVAERAGVPPGLVHYHFDSVEELKRLAALTALQDEIDRTIGPMQDLTPRDILAAAGEWLASIRPGDPFMTLMFESLPVAARDPGMQRELGAMLTWFRDLLAERIRACHPEPHAPPEVLAEVFAATFDGLGMHRVTLPDLDVRAHVAPLFDLLGPERDRATSQPATGREADR